MLRHYNVRAHQCQQCGERFVESYDLARHQRQAHGSERPFKCPLCPLRFKHVSAMYTHSKKRHHVKLMRQKQVSVEELPDGELAEKLWQECQGKGYRDPVRCVVCLANFQRRDSMYHHGKVTHKRDFKTVLHQYMEQQGMKSGDFGAAKNTASPEHKQSDADLPLDLLVLNKANSQSSLQLDTMSNMSGSSEKENCSSVCSPSASPFSVDVESANKERSAANSPTIPTVAKSKQPKVRKFIEYTGKNNREKRVSVTMDTGVNKTMQKEKPKYVVDKVLAEKPKSTNVAMRNKFMKFVECDVSEGSNANTAETGKNKRKRVQNNKKKSDPKAATQAQNGLKMVECAGPEGKAIDVVSTEVSADIVVEQCNGFVNMDLHNKMDSVCTDVNSSDATVVIMTSGISSETGNQQSNEVVGDGGSEGIQYDVIIPPSNPVDNVEIVSNELNDAAAIPPQNDSYNSNLMYSLIDEPFSESSALSTSTQMPGLSLDTFLDVPSLSDPIEGGNAQSIPISLANCFPDLSRVSNFTDLTNTFMVTNNNTDINSNLPNDQAGKMPLNNNNNNLPVKSLMMRRGSSISSDEPGFQLKDLVSSDSMITLSEDVGVEASTDVSNAQVFIQPLATEHKHLSLQSQL